MTVSAQHLLCILDETKPRSTPDLSVPDHCPAAGSFLLLLGLECFSLPLRPAPFACTDSAGGWSTHCSGPVFRDISWKTCLPWHVHWLEVSYSPGWLGSEGEEDGLRHKICFKKRKLGCAQFLREIKASSPQEMMLIWVQRWRFLCADLEAPPFALSTHSELSAPNAISFWNASSEKPNPTHCRGNCSAQQLCLQCSLYSA